MKTLTLLLLLTHFTIHAQQRTGIVIAGLIAGIADGQREVIVHNPHAYRYRHPNANERWWNPDSTWRRADRYPGALVFAADKHHLNQFIRQSMFVGQTTLIVTLHFGQKIRWKQLLIDIALAQGSYMVAKGLTHRWYDVW